MIQKSSKKQIQELKDYLEKNRHKLYQSEINIIENILKLYEK